MECHNTMDDVFMKAVFNVLKPHMPEEFDFKTFSVTKAADEGEHFSNSLIGLNIVLKNVSRNTTESLHVIIKYLNRKISESNPVTLKSFLKEIQFYKSAVPEYLIIQKEYDLPTEKILDIFPKFYGFTELPEESEFRMIMILENLKSAGYKTFNERKSLDHFHAELALKELAKFHAIGVVLKLKKPEVHKMLLNTMAMPALKSEGDPKKDEHYFKFRNEIKNVVLALNGYGQYADSVYNALEKIDKEGLPPVCEPYATFLHNDFWLNNILFRHISENCVTIKCIDYETAVYNSPARDIAYFLFTSTLLDISNDYHNFVELYHKTFIDCLLNFDCDTELFTLEIFFDEMNKYAPSKLKHIITLLKSYIPKAHNIGEAVISSVHKKNNETFEKRLASVLKGFVSRRWIQGN